MKTSHERKGKKGERPGPGPPSQRLLQSGERARRLPPSAQGARKGGKRAVLPGQRKEEKKKKLKPTGERTLDAGPRCAKKKRARGGRHERGKENKEAVICKRGRRKQGARGRRQSPLLPGPAKGDRLMSLVAKRERRSVTVAHLSQQKGKGGGKKKTGIRKEKDNKR